MASDSSYRPDIDGLRAIAVTSVVAFHASPGFARGGFVGVDVFFVISGYLITGLLLREATRTRSVGLAEFYARRIRRLFPALVTVLLAVLLASHFLLLPVLEQPKLAASTISTATYVSNFFFKAAAGDYFARPTEEQPLLHTWSLSVEEQFYLVWPLLVLAVCWLAPRLRLDLRRLLLVALAPLVLVSFWLYVRWSATAPGVAFYYLPARAWELGAGALLAVALEARPAGGRVVGVNVLFGAGVVALVASVFLIDRTMAPGPAVAIPVLGTLACLAAGALGSELAPRVLGAAGPVAIGKVSYSWYLWHWPLLAIARARALGALDPRRDFILALVALGLAFATLKLVENPIRHGKPGPFAKKWSTIASGIAMSGLVIAAALLLVTLAKQQAKDPRYAEIVALHDDRSPLHERCHITNALPAWDTCMIPGTDPRRELVVWGDSHAERMFAPSAEVARAHGISVVQRTSTACPPLLGTRPSGDDLRPNNACSRFNEAVIAELAERAKTHQLAVVLVARWPNYLATRSLEGVPTRTLYEADRRAGDPAQLMDRGLDATIARLASLGIRTVVVAAMPELPHSAPECFVRDPDHCGVSRAAAEQYRASSQTIIERVVQRHAEHAVLVDAFAAFCDRAECSPKLDGKLAYVDAHHLAFSAAAKLARFFETPLRWALRL